VAAKRLPLGRSEEEEALFNREVALLCSLTGAVNVLAVHGLCGVKSDLMVMEFCSGGELGAYYTIKSFFTRAEFDRVGREVCAGLAHLHHHHIPHRNLKPSNILLEPLTRRVRIAGFGQCRFGRGEQPEFHAYMPPEAPVPSAEAAARALFEGVMDAQQAGESSSLLGKQIGKLFGGRREVRIPDLPPFDPFAGDVYSLGLVLWQLWFRVDPFAGQTPSRVADHVRRGKRLPLHGIPDAAPLPAALRHVVEAAWAQDPSERPSCSGVSRSFDAFAFPGEPPAFDLK